MKELKNTIATLAVFVSRFIGLPANVSAVGSLGFYNSNPFLYFAVIGFYDFFFGGLYRGMAFTYLGFFAYFVLGRLAKNKIERQVILMPLASFLFFVFSNFGVWWYWYPHTISGLLLCYSLALPFYQQTLFGDIFFGYGVLLVRLVQQQRSTTIANPLTDLKKMKTL